MTPTDDDSTSATPSEPPSAPEPVPTRTALSGIRSSLFRPRLPPTSSGGSSTKQIVEGLDRRELQFGYSTVAINALLVLTYWRDLGKDVKLHHVDSGEFLVEGLVTAAIVLLGVVLKRRALLGFAAFFIAFYWLSFSVLPLFLLNAALGGWLLWRASQASKARAGQRPRERATRSPRATKTPTGPRRPAPSKRYTPPKRKPPKIPSS